MVYSVIGQTLFHEDGMICYIAVYPSMLIFVARLQCHMMLDLPSSTGSGGGVAPLFHSLTSFRRSSFRPVMYRLICHCSTTLCLPMNEWTSWNILSFWTISVALWDKLLYGITSNCFPFEAQLYWDPGNDAYPLLAGIIHTPLMVLLPCRIICFSSAELSEGAPDYIICMVQWLCSRH